MVLRRALPPRPFFTEVLVALVLGACVLNTPLRKPIGLALPGPDREPDDYAPGLRFTGKWVLRLAIIAMGLKVQTSFFDRGEVLLIAGVPIWKRAALEHSSSPMPSAQQRCTAANGGSGRGGNDDLRSFGGECGRSGGARAS